MGPNVELHGARRYVAGAKESWSALRLMAGVVEPDDGCLYEHLLDVFPTSAGRCADQRIQRRMPRVSDPGPPLGDPSDVQLHRRMWDALCSAVDRSVPATGRVAVALGGVDSSAVFAALCEVRGTSNVVALTYDYANGADEPYAVALTAAYGVPLLRHRVVDALPYVPKALVMDGLPSIGWGACVELHMQEVVRRAEAELYLTGVFGDDMMGGDPTLFAHEALRSPRATFALLRRLEMPVPSSFAERLEHFVARPLARDMVPRAIRRRRLRRALLRRVPWLLPRPSIDGVIDAVTARTRAPRDGADVRRMREPMYWHSFIGRMQAVATGGVSRADPLVEDDFVKLALSVPIRRAFENGEYRGAFRRALPTRVPERVRSRVGKAEMHPQLRALAHQNRSELRRWADLERLVARGFVGDVSAFRERFETRGPLDHGVWAALSAEAFLAGAAS